MTMLDEIIEILLIVFVVVLSSQVRHIRRKLEKFDH